MSGTFIKDIKSYLGKENISNLKQANNYKYNIHSLKEKIGFKKLRIEKKVDSCSYFAIKAIKKLIKNNSSLLSKIKLIVIVSQNQDNFGIPHSSAIVHGKLGFPNDVACFDIGLGCSGYCYALSIVSGFMKINNIKNSLLITSDQYSNILKPKDMNTKLIFSDASTATWLSNEGEFEIICSDFGTNGELSNSLSKDNKNKLSMNGRAIYNFCQEKIPNHINSFIKKNNIRIKNIDCFLLHQASKAIIMAIRKKLILKSDKVPFESEFIGNTVSSSIPLLLEKRLKNKKLKKIIMSGFGVGLSWSSVYIKR